MNFQFLIDGEKVFGSVEPHGDSQLVTIGNERIEVQSRSIDENTLLLSLGNRTILIHFVYADKKLYLTSGQSVYQVEELIDSAGGRPVDHLVDNMITAPMPGLVVKVNCCPGDPVKKGQILVIVEAMKMENQMRSPLTGKVKRVTCKGGDRVDANQLLVELENG